MEFLKGLIMKQTEWVLYPVCSSKTRNKIREDTVLINYSLYCPKCRKETLIEVGISANNESKSSWLDFDDCRESRMPKGIRHDMIV